MRLGVVLVLLLTGGLARAAGPAERIVRAAHEVAGAKPSREPIVVAAGKRVEVWVRPGARVVGVTQRGRIFGFPRQHGFLLDAQGKLSAKDQAALASLLAEHTPRATVASVDRALAGAAAEGAARDRMLRGQDPVIGGLLARIQAHRGPGELVLHSDRRSTLTYRPSTNVIVETRGFSQRGYFLERRDSGLVVAPQSLDELRAYVASRNVSPR